MTNNPGKEASVVAAEPNSPTASRNGEGVFASKTPASQSNQHDADDSSSELSDPPDDLEILSLSSASTVSVRRQTPVVPRGNLYDHGPVEVLHLKVQTDYERLQFLLDADPMNIDHLYALHLHLKEEWFDEFTDDSLAIQLTRLNGAPNLEAIYLHVEGDYAFTADSYIAHASEMIVSTSSSDLSDMTGSKSSDEEVVSPDSESGEGEEPSNIASTAESNDSDSDNDGDLDSDAVKRIRDPSADDAEDGLVSGDDDDNEAETGEAPAIASLDGTADEAGPSRTRNNNVNVGQDQAHDDGSHDESDDDSDEESESDSDDAEEEPADDSSDEEADGSSSPSAESDDADSDGSDSDDDDDNDSDDSEDSVWTGPVYSWLSNAAMTEEEEARVRELLEDDALVYKTPKETVGALIRLARECAIFVDGPIEVGLMKRLGVCATPGVQVTELFDLEVMSARPVGRNAVRSREGKCLCPTDPIFRVPMGWAVRREGEGVDGGDQDGNEEVAGESSSSSDDPYREMEERNWMLLQRFLEANEKRLEAVEELRRFDALVEAGVEDDLEADGDVEDGGDSDDEDEEEEDEEEEEEEGEEDDEEEEEEEEDAEDEAEEEEEVEGEEDDEGEVEKGADGDEG